MPRGRRPATVTELPDIKVGDRVVIIQEGPKKGQHDAVLEVNAKKATVRLAVFGWEKRSDVEVLDGPIEPPPNAESKNGKSNGTNAAPTSIATHSFSVGDIALVKDSHHGPHAGQTAVVVAVDHDDQTIQLENFGWFQDDQLEPFAEKLKTDVDGKPANVVLDGLTGAPAEHAMVKPSLDDLVRALARANEKLGAATIAKKRAQDSFKDAQGAVNAIVVEIIQNYGNASQLALNLSAGTAGGAAPVDDDDDEEDETEATLPVDAGTQIGGVREYSAGEGPE